MSNSKDCKQPLVSPGSAPAEAMAVVYDAAGKTTAQQLANLARDSGSAQLIWQTATATSVLKIVAML